MNDIERKKGIETMRHEIDGLLKKGAPSGLINMDFHAVRRFKSICEKAIKVSKSPKSSFDAMRSSLNQLKAYYT